MLVDVGAVELKLDLLRLGQHRDGRGRGVHAPLGLGGGDAFDAVGAGLVGEVGPDALARDGRGGGADASHRVVCVVVDDLEGPPAPARAFLVHAEEVGAPEARFIAADARAELEDDGADGSVVGVDEAFEGGVEDRLCAIAEFGEFGASELDEFGVGLGVVDELLVLFGFVVEGVVLGEPVCDGVEGGLLDGEVADLGVVAEDVGVLELRADGVARAHDLAQLVEEGVVEARGGHHVSVGRRAACR